MWLTRGAEIPPRLLERGREWQRDNVLRELDPGAEILFCLPLKDSSRSNDWSRVNRYLGLTIQSLLDQTDGRWRAIVCCQDRPELPDDPRISYLAYRGEKERETNSRNDKHDKLKAIHEHFANLGPWDGYVFNLDADDLVHPSLVEYFLSDRSPSGYILRAGYIYDVGADRLGFLHPPSLRRPWAKPFYGYCGSCSAIRFDLRKGKSFLELVHARGKRHREQKLRLRKFGVDLAPVDYPAAVYVINHGDNDQLSKGNMGRKISYLKRNQVRGIAACEARKTFRLDRVLSVQTARETAGCSKND